MYPGKFKSQFTNPDSVNNWRETWAETFVEYKLTFVEIKRGLDVCMKSRDWPPSLPEFLKCCRPPIDYEKAYYEAVKQLAIRSVPVIENGMEVTKDVWSRSEIYWAAKTMAYDIGKFEYKILRTRWEMAIDDAVEKQYGDVPEVMRALPPPIQITMPPEKAKEKISEIMGLLGNTFRRKE